MSDSSLSINQRTMVSPDRQVNFVTTSLTHVLRQTEGPGAPQDIVVTGDQVVIGRSKTVDIVIGSMELSRRHMVLRKEGAEYVVEDLDSQNGVYLNGVRIHSAVLRGGDTIHVGEVTFLYLEGM